MSTLKQDHIDKLTSFTNKALLAMQVIRAGQVEDLLSSYAALMASALWLPDDAPRASASGSSSVGGSLGTSSSSMGGAGAQMNASAHDKESSLILDLLRKYPGMLERSTEQVLAAIKLLDQAMAREDKISASSAPLGEFVTGELVADETQGLILAELCKQTTLLSSLVAQCEADGPEGAMRIDVSGLEPAHDPVSGTVVPSKSAAAPLPERDFDNAAPWSSATPYAVGAPVMLNSGGPAMTVKSLSAICAWDGGESAFPVECLTPISAGADTSGLPG
ncbi:MAG: hypothetical protein V4724_26815 [Pseudomonadota bacterium]